MSCKHEFVEAAIMVCKKCCKTMRVLEMEERLDAANANNKALREENELLRHKAAGHDATMLQTELAAANARASEAEQQFSVQYVKTCRAEQRAEKAEARCAAVATAYQIMKGDFEHWAYCELIDSPPGKKCTCGVWEMVEAIEAASEGKS